MLFGTRRPRRVAVFISGSGSTLQALLDMHHDLNIVLVVSNKKAASGTLKAKRFGKSIFYFSKDVSFQQLQKKLEEYRIDSVFLAGFMKILPLDFINKWNGRILNIHPSLLPAFPGLEAAEKSHLAKQPMGVSIHEVNEGIDEGKILMQMTSLPGTKVSQSDLAQALLQLRQKEQHLLREVSVKWRV